MSADDYGTVEEAIFKESLVSTMGGYIDAADDVTSTTATDYVSVRLRRHLSDASEMIQIDFTLSVDMTANGFDDENALASSFSSDMTTAVSSGVLTSAITAQADDSSPLASVSVAVNESTSAIVEATTVTAVEVVTTASDDGSGTSSASVGSSSSKGGSSSVSPVPIFIVAAVVVVGGAAFAASRLLRTSTESKPPGEPAPESSPAISKGNPVAITQQMSNELALGDETAHTRPNGVLLGEKEAEC